jgi:hypothetical protein
MDKFFYIAAGLCIVMPNSKKKAEVQLWVEKEEITVSGESSALAKLRGKLSSCMS